MFSSSDRTNKLRLSVWRFAARKVSLRLRANSVPGRMGPGSPTPEAGVSSTSVPRFDTLTSGKYSATTCSLFRRIVLSLSLVEDDDRFLGGDRKAGVGSGMFCSRGSTASCVSIWLSVDALLLLEPSIWRTCLSLARSKRYLFAGSGCSPPA